MATEKDFTSTYKPTWCPGCGNYGIYPATKRALAELGIKPHEAVMVFGIGCSSNGANCYKLYSFHSIHGRSLPVAIGVKLANHELTVLADSGDGDGYSEGTNHFVHACRGNADITYLVHDNRMYSLTQGQTSPTSLKGTKTVTTPAGSINEPFNPVATALVSGATFVAQGFSGDIPHLADLIKKAIQHRGFSLVNILQVCTTYNKVNTFDWYKQHTYKLDATYNPADFNGALLAATRTDGKLPLGILYQTKRPTYDEQIPQIKVEPLVRQPIKVADLEPAFDSYR
ncbi:MAG: 2-oxoacid:ferredoxin oxidoreductase subunit beta [Patescibacteria group bacterium]|nr:2-oxoacid:ferredoxin oxidoreductase subunit beta [Patescibacteria group bacterium]MDD5715186.1 2-oxoacid:ferredoxin oxidoreductase subunit beta [Patescibacteria group bacterium]